MKILILSQASQKPQLPGKPLHLWQPSAIAVSLRINSSPQEGKLATLEVSKHEEQPLLPTVTKR